MKAALNCEEAFSAKTPLYRYTMGRDRLALTSWTNEDETGPVWRLWATYYSYHSNNDLKRTLNILDLGS